MADLGFILCGLGNVPVTDEDGDVILFRTRADAESVARYDQQALQLVRYRKARK